MSDAARPSADTGAIRVAVSASAFEPHSPKSTPPDWVQVLRRALEQYLTLVPMGTARATRTDGQDTSVIAEPAGWIVAEGETREAIPSWASSIRPIEDTQRLRHPDRRDQFILRVRIHHRWQCLRATGLTPGALVAFQAEHKYLVLAHAPERARRLGRLAAEAGRSGVEAVADDYAGELMAALAEPADRRGHYNALQHAAGHLRGCIGDAERATLHDAIDRFAAGETALAEPLRLLRDLARQRGSDWIAHQRYIDDGPMAEPGPR